MFYGSMTIVYYWIGELSEIICLSVILLYGLQFSVYVGASYVKNHCLFT